MAKKKILTEDAFNANGSTHIDEKVLNENAAKEIKEDVTDDEKINDNDVVINDVDDNINPDNDLLKDEKEVVVDETETKDDKVLESTITVNATTKERLTKYDYGFNDEAAYIK